MSSHTAASNTSTTSTASTGTAGTTGTTDTPSTPAATSERILDAALACAAELGLTQLTLEEVATRAEVSRQTVYRHFGRREALISAVIVREESALLATVQAATQAASTLPEAVEIAVVELYRQARAHPLLDRLLRDEPGAILPYLLPGNAPGDRGGGGRDQRPARPLRVRPPRRPPSPPGRHHRPPVRQLRGLPR
jgi:AcrR family transcriptional regulator